MLIAIDQSDVEAARFIAEAGEDGEGKGRVPAPIGSDGKEVYFLATPLGLFDCPLGKLRPLVQPTPETLVLLHSLNELTKRRCNIPLFAKQSISTVGHASSNSSTSTMSTPRWRSASAYGR